MILNQKRFQETKMIGNIIIQNWSVLLCFEMLYRGIGFSFLFPFVKYIINKLPDLLGLRYLSQENVLEIFRHPTSILMLSGTLILTSLYIFFEIAALILYCEKSWSRKKITVLGIWRETFFKTLHLLSPKRLPALLMLPVLTFSVFSFISGYLQVIEIPEFILEYMKGNPLLFLLLSVFILLCNILFFFYLFGLPSLFLNGTSFIGSFRESFRLLKGKKSDAFGTILIHSMIYTGILSAIPTVFFGLMALIIRFLKGMQNGRGEFRFYYLSFKRIWQITANALFAVFLCAVVIVLFHRYKGESQPPASKKNWTVKRFVFRFLTIIGTLSVLMIYSESELGGRIWHDPQTTKIIAHRAGASIGPENTVAALNQSIKDHAFIAEIDVQRLKDQTLIVMHDTNFKRTTGTDLFVWDADYNQVKTLDAGSFFSSKFQGEPVPTLEEMLKAAKGRIDLMIELKAAGPDRELVKNTLDLIKAYQMQSHCMIASMNMDILEQVKTLDPNIKTVYISVLLLSNRYDLEHIDAYSLETSALSYALVIEAHHQNKQVYAWTANTKDTIEQIISCTADGVITDNPLLARYTLDTMGRDILLEIFSDFFFPIQEESSAFLPDIPNPE